MCDIDEGISSEVFFLEGGGGIPCLLLSNFFSQKLYGFRDAQMDVSAARIFMLCIRFVICLI